MTETPQRKEEQHIVEDLTQLTKLAKSLKSKLITPSLILLEGSLGTGKTALVKKLLAEYGLSENKVKSPTFSLINLYRQENLTIAHLDLYRLDQHDRFLLEEIKEILQSVNPIVLIEWPEKMNLETLHPLARQIISIKIEFIENNFRKFHIYAKNQ